MPFLRARLHSGCSLLSQDGHLFTCPHSVQAKVVADVGSAEAAAAEVHRAFRELEKLHGGGARGLATLEVGAVGWPAVVGALHVHNCTAADALLARGVGWPDGPCRPDIHCTLAVPSCAHCRPSLWRAAPTACRKWQTRAPTCPSTSEGGSSGHGWQAGFASKGQAAPCCMTWQVHCACG